MTDTATPYVRPESPAEVLAAARDRRRVADAAEADLVELAVQWAVLHPVDSLEVDPAVIDVPGADTDMTIAGPGAPQITEFCVAEFAAAVGLSTDAGKRFLGDAIELRYRLPRLYRRVVHGTLQAWKARTIARATLRLSAEGAAFVDAQVAHVAHKIGPIALDRLVLTATCRYMPEEMQRLIDQGLDARHVTIHRPIRPSITGTWELTAELDIADALDLEAALAAGAAQRAALGSAETLDVRRSQTLGDLARHQPTLDLPSLVEHPATATAESGAPAVAETLGGPPSQLEPGQPAAMPVSGEPAEPTNGRRAPGRCVPHRRHVVLYVHLSQAALAGQDPLARLEHAHTIISTDQVKTWCASPATTQITLTPVLDLTTCDEVDSDAVPHRLRDKITVRDHTCVFPWCTRPARPHHPDPDGHGRSPGGHGCDADHIHPRSRGGPTCTCNLAPLCRRHHRLKTHSPWTYTTLEPGTYLWSSPHGYQLLRDPSGTLDVTRNP
jgi:hypothetical protein